MDEARIEWTDYMRYRAELRGFDLAAIEDVVPYSNERYVDRATGRLIAVGKCGDYLIMVPYEVEKGLVRPITAHVTARAQIDARIRSGRFRHE